MNNIVAAIQMTSGPEVINNLSVAKSLIHQAVEQGARLIVLPENFAMMGVGQQYKIKHRELLGEGPIQSFLSTMAKNYGIVLIGGTIPISIKGNNEKAYTTCLVFDDQGKLSAHYHKIHLFDVCLPEGKESYFESEFFVPGHEIKVVETPVGKVGLAVCYDVRFPEQFRALQAAGAEIVVLPSAFTVPTGIAHWEVLVRARAIENQIYMVTAAQWGVHADARKTYGHSMIVGPWGGVKSILPEKSGIILADIDLMQLHRLRKEFPALLHIT